MKIETLQHVNRNKGRKRNTSTLAATCAGLSSQYRAKYEDETALGLLWLFLEAEGKQQQHRPAVISRKHPEIQIAQQSRRGKEQVLYKFNVKKKNSVSLSEQDLPLKQFIKGETTRRNAVTFQTHRRPVKDD